MKITLYATVPWRYFIISFVPVYAQTADMMRLRWTGDEFGRFIDEQ